MPEKIAVTGTDKGEYAVTVKYNRFGGIASRFVDVYNRFVGTDTNKIELDLQATQNIIKELDGR